MAEVRRRGGGAGGLTDPSFGPIFVRSRGQPSYARAAPSVLPSNPATIAATTTTTTTTTSVAMHGGTGPSGGGGGGNGALTAVRVLTSGSYAGRRRSASVGRMTPQVRGVID